MNGNSCQFATPLVSFRPNDNPVSHRSILVGLDLAAVSDCCVGTTNAETSGPICDAMEEEPERFSDNPKEIDPLPDFGDLNNLVTG